MRGACDFRALADGLVRWEARARVTAESSSFSSVRLTEDRVVVPPECACCGGLASRVVLEARFASKARVLVPYCANCHEHAARARTRALAAALSSALLAFTVTAGLPFVIQPPSAAVYAVVAFVAAVLPLLLARRRPHRADAGHATGGRAAFWAPDGSFVCADARWAARLAEASHTTSSATHRREPATPPLAAAFPIAAAVAALLLYPLHFPVVRVLDVASTRLVVSADGRAVTRIEPTSAESAAAGVSVRIPAGRHVLTATDPSGHVVDTVTVTVQGGSQHLYAPGSAGVCFWIEATSYGRRGEPVTVEPLSTDGTFWALPHAIDVWFAPSPPAPEGDTRSSGGVSYALRHAPCGVVSERLRGFAR